MILEGANYAYVNGDLGVVDEYTNYIWTGTDIVDPVEILPAPYGVILGGPFTQTTELDNCNVRITMWGAPSASGTVTLRYFSDPLLVNEEIVIAMGWRVGTGGDAEYYATTVFYGYLTNFSRGDYYRDEDGNAFEPIKFSAVGRVQEAFSDEYEFEGMAIQGDRVVDLLDTIKNSVGYMGNYALQCQDRTLVEGEKFKYRTNKPWKFFNDIAMLGGGSIVYENLGTLCVTNALSTFAAPTVVTADINSVEKVTINENFDEIITGVRVWGGTGDATLEYIDAALELEYGAVRVDYYNDYLLTSYDANRAAQEIIWRGKMQATQHSIHGRGHPAMVPGLGVKIVLPAGTMYCVSTKVSHSFSPSSYKTVMTVYEY